MKGKSRTPSGPQGPDTLTWVMAGLAGLGLLVSAYLTSVHYAAVPLVCLGTTGCEEVNRSIFSVVAGLPVALLGVGAYAVVLISLWAERQAILKTQEGVLAQFGVALTGTLFSLYLTYVELFVLRAVCIWCVISAVAITVILALAIVRLRAVVEAETALPPVKAKGKAK